MKHARLALILALAPLTSGCVAAAVAAPFLAGGALATRDTIDESRSRPEVAPEAVDESSVPAAPIAKTAARPKPEPAAEGQGPAAAQTLSVPSPAPSQQGTKISNDPASKNLVRLAEYATQTLAAQSSKDPLLSAVLKAPEALDGERRTCASDQPTVLIDLDPADSLFSTDSPLPQSEIAAESLAQLRQSGITLVWTSGNSAADADIVRTALSEAGLDPNSQDRLLLMRYPGDRKQTRRAELASETCLIAIAGEERSDFDELYDYLKNPDAALALEPIIGNGWFLLRQSGDRIGPASSADTGSINPQEEIEQ